MLNMYLIMQSFVHNAPIMALTPEWGQWSWKSYCAPRSLHTSPEEFGNYMHWVKHMKKAIKKADTARLHGYCSSIALSIGIILSDLDMIDRNFHPERPYRKIPSYIKFSTLDRAIIDTFLLPMCVDFKDIIIHLSKKGKSSRGSRSQTMNQKTVSGIAFQNNVAAHGSAVATKLFPRLTVESVGTI